MESGSYATSPRSAGAIEVDEHRRLLAKVVQHALDRAVVGRGRERLVRREPLWLRTLTRQNTSTTASELERRAGCEAPGLRTGRRLPRGSGVPWSTAPLVTSGANDLGGTFACRARRNAGARGRGGTRPLRNPGRLARGAQDASARRPRGASRTTLRTGTSMSIEVARRPTWIRGFEVHAFTAPRPDRPRCRRVREGI